MIGILAALRHRERDGRGQYVDIAMFDAMVAMTDIVTNYWSLGVRPEPRAPRSQVISQGFRAKSDGWFVMQIVREPQFAKLVELIGHPEWKDDPRFATRAGCGSNLEAVMRPGGRGVGVGADQDRGRASTGRRASWPVLASRAKRSIVDPHVAARHMLVEMPRTDGVGAPVLCPGTR